MSNLFFEDYTKDKHDLVRQIAEMDYKLTEMNEKMDRVIETNINLIATLLLFTIIKIAS